MLYSHTQSQPHELDQAVTTLLIGIGVPCLSAKLVQLVSAANRVGPAKRVEAAPKVNV